MPGLAPYAEQHKSPKGPGDARPTAVKIIEDQGLVADPSWAGRVVLITGCSAGGLGPETAKAIHLTGADVYITVRDAAKGKEIADEVKADGKPGKVEVIVAEGQSVGKTVTPGTTMCYRAQQRDPERHLGLLATMIFQLSSSRIDYSKMYD